MAGFGYGLALTLSKIPGAQLRGRRYEEESGRRERQLVVNEKAEDRAGRTADEAIAHSKQYRKKDIAEAEGASEADATIRGDGPGESALTPDVGPPAPALPIAPEAPAVSQYGNPVEDVDGQKTDIVTGEPAPDEAGVGKSGPTQPPEKGTVGGQKPGLPAKTGLGYKAPSAAKAKPPGETYPGVAPKVDEAARQGKSIITPRESETYVAQAAKLEEDSKAVADRLQQSLKMVDQRYGNDPTMAAYLKANIRAKVGGHLDMMRTNAARLRQEGALADHMQRGARFAESVLSHISSGGMVDDKWIKANEGIAKELGVDPGILRGMHQTKNGFIANAGGAIIPQSALMRVANPALPWLERAKGWEEIDKMYKIQAEISQGWARVKNADPSEFLKMIMTTASDLHGQYQRLENGLQNALATAIKGGQVEITDKSGAKKKIALKARPDRSGNWVDAMRTSEDPNDRDYWENILEPLYSKRSLVGTLNEFILRASKSKVDARLPGEVRNVGEAEAEVAGEKAEAVEAGKAKGQKAAKNKK